MKSLAHTQNHHLSYLFTLTSPFITNIPTVWLDIAKSFTRIHNHTVSQTLSESSSLTFLLKQLPTYQSLMYGLYWSLLQRVLQRPIQSVAQTLSQSPIQWHDLFPSVSFWHLWSLIHNCYQALNTFYRHSLSRPILHHHFPHTVSLSRTNTITASPVSLTHRSRGLPVSYSQFFTNI